MLKFIHYSKGPPVLVQKQPEETLNALASRLRHSDHEAFEAIFRQMNEPLLRYAYRFVKSKQQALDILQDVFLKLWEKRTSLEIKISLNALLYTMTRNRALNINRNDAKFADHVDVCLAKQELTEESSIESALSASQLDAFFKTCVQELPPRRAEAFVLSRYHELSHREIGTIMGLSKRTVDTHIVHALKYIRARYESLEAKGTKS